MIIGLTGGICTGKTTATNIFLSNNIPVVDADKVARDVVTINSSGYKQIVDTFGDKYLNYPDLTINRTKLGNFVFANKDQLAKLNSIMKPLIAEESARQLSNFAKSGHKIVVYDAALLIEMGNADKYRPLIVMSCPREMQLKRLMKRNSLTEQQAEDRLSAQMSTEERVKFANYIIDTSGTIEESIIQTKDILNKIKMEL